MSKVSIGKDVTGAVTLSIISTAEKFNRWMYEEIKPNLTGRVLEIGSGIGNISRFVLEDNFETVLSDYNNDYVDVLKKKFGGHINLEKVLLLDLQDPEFEQNNQSMHNTFDTVILLNVIEHLKDDYRAVANCRYLLKPAGRLVLLAPAYRFLHCNLDDQLGHYRRYTTNLLAQRLRANQMIVIEKKYFNLAGIGGWLIWGKIFRKNQLQMGGMAIFNRAVPFLKLIDQLFFKKIGLSAIVTGKKI